MVRKYFLIPALLSILFLAPAPIQAQCLEGFEDAEGNCVDETTYNESNGTEGAEDYTAIDTESGGLNAVAPKNSVGTQGSINITYLKGYAQSVKDIINNLIVPVLIAIAFLVFLWGAYKYYIYKGDSDTERAKGHQFMIWGIIGLVVIFSVWGIVNIVRTTLSLDQAPGGYTAPAPPKI